MDLTSVSKSGSRNLIPYGPTRLIIAANTGSAFLRCSMALRMLKQSGEGIRHHFIGMRSITSAVLCASLLALPMLPQQKPAEDISPPPIKVDVDIVNILASVRNKQNGLV